MNYLQEDLKKLIKYAQGLGLKVSIRDYDGKGAGGGWTTDGKEITLFKWKNITTTRMILNLLHELAHHLAWVYADRTSSSDLEYALDMEDSRTKRSSSPIPKEMRRLIYEEEKHDAQYRESIAKEVGLRIPWWKIKSDMEVDIWGYRIYYETGNHPTQKEINEKYRELKVRNKNG